MKPSFIQALDARNTWARRNMPLSGLMKASPILRSDYIALGARRARKFAGDPEDVSVTRLTPDSVEKVIAATLSGIPASERRGVVLRAMEDARGEHNIIVPWFAAIPKDASVQDAAKFINGAGSLCLALGSKSGDATVNDVMATAGAMADRAPLAADPLQPTDLNESTMAKILLDAFTVDADLAKKYEVDDAVLGALRNIAAIETARSAAFDDEKRPIDELDHAPSLQRDAFDCAVHHGYLGGDPEYMAGSLKSFLKNAWGKIMGQAESSASSKVNQITSDAIIAYVNDRRTSVARSMFDKEWSALSPDEQTSVMRVVWNDAVQAYGKDAISRVYGTPDMLDNGASNEDPASPAVSADSALDDSVDQAKAALQSAIATLNSSKESAKDLKAQAEKEALKVAKLSWAQQMLQAPDEVAEILARVSPNASDTSAFLSSALALLPAAKSTGSIGTISALVSAIRSAVSRGDVSDGSILTALSGDAAPAPASEVSAAVDSALSRLSSD